MSLGDVRYQISGLGLRPLMTLSRQRPIGAVYCRLALWEITEQEREELA